MFRFLFRNGWERSVTSVDNGAGTRRRPAGQTTEKPSATLRQSPGAPLEAEHPGRQCCGSHLSIRYPAESPAQQRTPRLRQRGKLPRGGRATRSSSSSHSVGSVI